MKILQLTCSTWNLLRGLLLLSTQRQLRSKREFEFKYSFAYERGSIVVRAHAVLAEGLQFESDSMPLLFYYECNSNPPWWMETFFFHQVLHVNGRDNIVVRAYASHAEGLRFEPDSMPWLNARSLFTQQQMGTWWKYLGDKGGEEWT